MAIFKDYKKVEAKDVPAVKDLLPSTAVVSGLAPDQVPSGLQGTLSISLQILVAVKMVMVSRQWPLNVFQHETQLLQRFRSLKSGVLIPDTIHLLTTNVTSMRFAFQCSLSSISLHCRLHNGLTLRQSTLCPTSCGLQYSDCGFVQKKGIVLSKYILIIRQSDEHCTLVKDLSEYVRIVDG